LPQNDDYDDYYKYFTRQNLKYKYLRKNVSVVQEMFSTSLNFQEITGLRNGRGLFCGEGGDKIDPRGPDQGVRVNKGGKRRLGEGYPKVNVAFRLTSELLDTTDLLLLT